MQPGSIGAWAAYAAGWNAFGRWRAPVVIAAVPIGVLAMSTSTQPDEWWEPAVILTVATLLQLYTALSLRRLDQPDSRRTLSIYYAITAFFGVAASTVATSIPSVGLFAGAAMGVGVASMAFTAFYLLHHWDQLAHAHSDAALFLGSTHTPWRSSLVLQQQFVHGLRTQMD